VACLRLLRRYFTSPAARGLFLEIVGVGLELASVPVPPLPAREVEPGGLVLPVLDDVLADVPHHHRQFLGPLLLVQGRPEERQGVDREAGAVTVEKFPHGIAFPPGVGENRVDEGIEVVGVVLVRLPPLPGVPDFLQLPLLVPRQPAHARLLHPRDEGRPVRLGDLQAMDDGGGGVGGGALAPAGKPAPAAVRKLHRRQAPHPLPRHVPHRLLVEDGIALPALPLRRPFDVVADLPGVEVSPLVADRLQIDPHLEDDPLGDDSREEAVQRLLGAAVGVFDEVREGVDHRPGEGRRVTDLETGFLDASFGGDGESEAPGSIPGANDTAEGVGLAHAVDVDGKAHLHGVGLFVGEGLHPHHRLPFAQDLHPPVDAKLSAGGNGHHPGSGPHRPEDVALEFEEGPDRLLPLQVVVDVRRKDDLVLFDEEARRLHADDDVLRRRCRGPLPRCGTSSR